MSSEKLHFFVLVHGNHGAKGDLSEIEKAILSLKNTNSVIVTFIFLIFQLKSEVNDNTHLGIEVGGEKLANEV
jgi:hypothetical protein